VPELHSHSGAHPANQKCRRASCRCVILGLWASEKTKTSCRIHSDLLSDIDCFRNTLLFPRNFLPQSERTVGPTGCGLKSKAEILFLIAPFEHDGRHQRLEVAVDAKTLRLGCAPIINCSADCRTILVDQTPIRISRSSRCRRRQTMEVIPLDEVVSTDPDS